MSPSGVQALGPGALGESKLNKQKHINYWKRCLKTYLPTAYTSTDSNRMLLAFFVVSALDLLGALLEHTKPEEREGYIDWIYRCQHPEGGFRGFPGTDFGDERNAENKMWDPANVPATYMALSALLILGDDLSRVKRRECLQWLRKLQRDTGSFGETLGENDNIEGGTDSRFGYCAAVVRWILRGAAKGEVEGVPDIDVDKLAECVSSAQTYDGGISESPYHEAHGGFTYCAINILAFIRRLPPHITDIGPGADRGPPGLGDLDSAVRWLVSRQTEILTEEDEPDIDDEDARDEAGSEPPKEEVRDLRGFGIFPEDNQALTRLELLWAGFNGRPNKIADTCYCFWELGALCALHRQHLTDTEACRRYLLDKTQHMVGGFGKVPGDPPDIYHSYLGLAALALLKDPSMKPIVPSACFSQDAARFLESLPWRKEITAGGDSLPQGFQYDLPSKIDERPKEGASDSNYMAMSGG
ncbi:terpenoid cyclases/Protein prenyltransferase [Rhizodiscina lignyota]|uniref:Terpenoid cyclases/Protein prenyltransferase n=1 Tax=Rhizodiscina lignyota TaxID=1504668 RepID=A0A9P4M598_9PEZI|nr:terpenoid cyclases/Protein prenyltransferase [Rhizodiscina lignyota]